MSDAVAPVAVCIVLIVRAVFWWRGRRAQAGLFELARDRRCPRCGRPTERNQMIAITSEDGTRDSSRALNRCACGELTVFDRAGGAQHADPPRADGVSAEGSNTQPARPAISVPIRILCGIVGFGFTLLAGIVAFDGTEPLVLLPLGFALLFLGVAIFASGPPPDAGVEWGRIRYDRVRRLQDGAISIGFLCFAVTSFLSYAGAPETWKSVLLPVGGILVALSMLLKFVVRYYGYYAKLSGD